MLMLYIKYIEAILKLSCCLVPSIMDILYNKLENFPKRFYKREAIQGLQISVQNIFWLI